MLISQYDSRVSSHVLQITTDVICYQMKYKIKTIIIVKYIEYRGDEKVVIGQKFTLMGPIPDYPHDYIKYLHNS